MPNMKHKTLSLIGVVAALVIASPNVIQAATSTWTGSANSYFTNAANWTPGFPATGDNIVLGATASVDLTSWNSGLGASYHTLGSLTFNSVAGTTLVGANGVLTLGGDLTQSGSGEITNSSVAYDLGAADRSFKGSGTGKVNFNNGSIANTAGVKVDGGYYVFGAVSGTFAGMTVNTGGTAEIRSLGLGSNLTLPGSGSASSIGTSQTLTINGGTAVLDTEDPAGAVDDFGGRTVTFGANGGTLIWNKSVVYAGGPAAFAFNNGINPARLINGVPMVGYFDNEQSAQLTSFSTGSGDVQVIVTNGGVATMVGNPGDLGLPYYYAPTYPTTNSFTRNDFKLTIFGQPGGDPTLGDSSTSIGRFMTGRWGNSWDTSNHTNRGNIQLITGGIFCRNVLLFLQRNSNPRFLGSDITIENGITLFSGGATANSRTLNIGTGDHPGLTNTTLRIKDGATAVLDQQVYSGQGSAGVRLNAKTVIEAGGSLQIKRTFTGYAGRPIVVTGSIEGQGSGTSGKDSVLVVDLPLAREDQFGRNDSSYTDPVTCFPGGSQGGGTLIDDPSQYQNSTGVKFYSDYANLIINAVAPNTLGLRVQGSSDYVANLLTEARLNSISGSQGVLTLAFTDSPTYTVSAGPTNTLSNIAIGFDNQDGSNPEYVVAANTTATNWNRIVVKNARVKLQDGLVMAKNLHLLGGTVALDDAATVSLAQVVLSENATIEMGTAGGAGVKLSLSSGGAWTAGKTLTVNNWNGDVNGGGPDQIFVGTSANLSAAQLAQVYWVNPFGSGDVAGAFQFPSGEIVPGAGQSYLSSPSGGGNGTDFQFNVMGVAGQTYVVDRTTNLTPTIVWTPVKTNTGSFLFTDTGSAGAPARFYRVRAQ
jgi:hypothetical protein